MSQTPSRSDLLAAATAVFVLWAPALVLLGTMHRPVVSEWLGIAAFSLWCLLAPLALIGRLRAYVLLGLPLVPLAAMWVYVCWQFGSVPGDALVSAALNSGAAQWREMLAAVGWPLLLLPVLALGYVALALRIPWGVRLGWPARKILLAVLLLYALLGTAGRQWLSPFVPLPPLFDSAAATLSFPAGLALATMRTLEHRQALAISASVRGRPAKGATSELLVVLVIGESVRSDHLGINGYARETTPRLTELGAELLSFRDVASTAQWTAVAVPNIVSRQTGAGRASLVQTFREAGFRTAWLSNQERSNLVQQADVSDYARGERDFHFRRDRALLPLLDSFASQAGKRQFVVLHMIGSHYPYEERYGAESRRFTPTLPALAEGWPKPAMRAQTINSYDNTIVEADKFLRGVIDRLAGERRPALMVYVSDHGENLFDDERGLFMHALPQPTRYDIHVPLLIWANALYRQQFGERMAALASRVRERVGHLDLFPTLLDLGAVDWDGAGPGQSLASPGFVAKPRRLATANGDFEGSSDELR